MQYLFDDIDYLNDDPAVQERKHAEYRKRFAKYRKRFTEIKDKFPKEFLKIYDVELFHDFQIKEIRFVPKKNRNDLMIQMTYFDDCYKVTYEHVDNIKMDFQGTYAPIIMFNELLGTENGLISSEFFLVNDQPCSISFTFKKLQFKKISERTIGGRFLTIMAFRGRIPE